jgi:hypothetical protein
VNAAANKPAPDRFVTSVVNKYDEIAAFAENIGAINTQTLRIFIVILIAFNVQ